MTPYSDKETYPSEKTTPSVSAASSRTSSPHPRHHRRNGERRDFPHHDSYHFDPRHMYPPPPPPHDAHHPHGFPPAPPPPGYLPHMMGMHPKDPFFHECAQRKPKRSAFRKVLVGGVVCLAGATVFTLGRGFEAHKINTVLNGKEDCTSFFPVLGISELTWGPGPEGKFHGAHEEHGFKGHAMEHGRHGRPHPPPPPPDMMRAHTKDWDNEEHDAEPRKYRGKKHHNGPAGKHHDRSRRPSTGDEESDEDSNERFGSDFERSRKHREQESQEGKSDDEVSE